MERQRQIRVFYNGSCPICAREIAHYRRAAQRCDAAIRFSDIETGDMRGLGLAADEARRRLHVLDGDALKAGLPAFRVLWRRLPRWRWLAALTGMPGIRECADLIYEGVLAPGLYRRDRLRRWRARRRVTRTARARLRSRRAASD